MFQIGVSAQKKTVPVLSALAAMGAAGLASQAMASTTITIDPDATSPIIKHGDPSYFGNSLNYIDPWSSWAGVEANGAHHDGLGFFTWNYDFSALAGKTIESATLVMGPLTNSYGFTTGNHITVGALASPVDLRTGWVGAFHDPYTSSVTQVFPNGGVPDGLYSVGMPFDMTDIVKAWQANPSTFHGVEIWSTDVNSGKGWIWNPGNSSYGPTNGGKLMITYSVPEPTTMGIGASVGGLMLLRRRRS